MLGVDISKGVNKEEIKLSQQIYSSNSIMKEESNSQLLSRIISSNKAFLILIGICFLSYIVYLIFSPNFNHILNIDLRLFNSSVSSIN